MRAVAAGQPSPSARPPRPSTTDLTELEQLEELDGDEGLLDVARESQLAAERAAFESLRLRKPHIR